MRKPRWLVSIYDRVLAVRQRRQAARGIRRIVRLDDLDPEERAALLVSRRKVSTKRKILHLSVTARPEAEVLSTVDRDLVILRDVVVDAYFGVALTRDGRVIEDTAIRRGPIESKMRSGKFFRTTRVVTVDRPVILLDCGPKNANFFHFWADSLSKFLFIDEPEVQARLPAYLIHSQSLAPWQVDVIQRATGACVELLEVDPLTRVEPPLFVSLPPYGVSGEDFLPDVDELRRIREWSSSLSSPEIPETRLYISRRLAKRRRLLNEDEIVEMLDGFGFRELRLEEHSVAAQIEAFRSAEFIVAPHGAGLIHLLHARPGARLLEIFTGKLGSYPRHYRGLAAIAGVYYSNLFCGAETHQSDAVAPIQEIRQWFVSHSLSGRTAEGEPSPGRS